MKSINLPPYAPTLIESTRAIGYSLEAAVADIIDNSITAAASRVNIYFFPIDEEYVAFLDDGLGMDEEEINIAMQYGSKNPQEYRGSNDLGRFGLGLKTASLSQSKTLTVISKKKNNICARRWDIDYVAETGEWSLLVLELQDIESIPHISELNQYASGTLVVWQKLDRLKAGETSFEQAIARKMDGVREHLSLVFHRYLVGESGLKKLQIRLNNQSIQPIDPFMSQKNNQAMDDELIIVNGEKIIVRPFILPHTSRMTAEELKMVGGKDGLRRQQGFYIYRNKRLLVWGTWFRMMRQGEMSKLVRIRVDIPNALDDLWTLDIKKSSAIPPAEVRSNLRAVIEKMAVRSKRTWTIRGKKETDDAVLHMWNRLRTRNGGYTYEINKSHPLVSEIYSAHPELKRSLDSLLSHIVSELPLNSLFIDLTNDEKIENEQLTSEEQVLSTARNILAGTNTELQETMIKKLLSAEPFNEYTEEILKAFEKGELS